MTTREDKRQDVIDAVEAATAAEEYHLAAELLTELPWHNQCPVCLDGHAAKWVIWRKRPLQVCEYCEYWHFDFSSEEEKIHAAPFKSRVELIPDENDDN